MKRRSQLALLFACVTFNAEFAVADPTQPQASPFQTARARYERAEALRERGELAESCELYRQSFDSYQSYLALCGIARCLAEVEGRLVEAIDAYQRARGLAKSQADVSFAESRIAAVEPRVAHLRIVLASARALPREIELRHNGLTTSVRAQETRRLDPGEYEVVASDGEGTTERARITLGPGEHRSLELRFSTAPSARVRVAAGSVVPRPARANAPNPIYLYAGATLLGAGALATSYGIARGLTVSSQREEMQRPGIDDGAYNALVRQARDARLDAVLFITGGSIGAVLGASSLLYYSEWWPFHRAAVQRGAPLATPGISACLAPRGISLQGSF